MPITVCSKSDLFLSENAFVQGEWGLVDGVRVTQVRIGYYLSVSMDTSVTFR